MSLASTKEHLGRLLADDESRVVALSGRWGTGKTFMWEEIKKSSEDEKVKGALYASLFGLSTIEQVKLKLIQSAVPSVSANPGLWEGAKQAFGTGVKVLEGFHSGFSALNDVGLLLAPAMLRQKILVLDDIERKHEDLSIDEVLGFIDEFSQQHGSRFVLILNSDKLQQKVVWDTLREKVVDQELRLSTSAIEAFDVAIGLTPSAWSDRIRGAVEACAVTNIRIIRKIIKAVNFILGTRQGISDAVLARVIPSTVLLAAIHYKGIEDGPDFDFVLSQGTERDWRLAEKESAETEEGRLKSSWKLLLNDLGILGCDEYELLVVEYLQSGLFDVAKVAHIIDRYIVEEEATQAHGACREFLERSFWDHTLTEQQLLEQARAVVDKAHLIDPYMITSLHDALEEIPGGKPLADEALTRWIGAFKAKNLQEADLGNVLHRKVHPRIEAEFNAIAARAQAKTSVLDACEHVAENSGWGVRQELAMKAATVGEFEKTIRNAPTKQLRFFMVKMLEFCVHKGTYEMHFGSAMDNFIEANRRIIQDATSPRLARLVKFLFDEAKLGHLLEPADQQPANEPQAT